VELAVQRALAELDFAPGELEEDQYDVTIIVPPEEGFMGVGAVDAVVEVTLLDDSLDFLGPENESRGNSRDEEMDSDEDSDEGFLEYGEGDSTAGLRTFLRRVLEEFGLDEAQVKISETPEELQAEVTGEDLGIFIGRRGQTIDAVEYLASIAVFKDARVRKHVELDAEGYKERRRRQIERIALRKAQEAARRGKPVQLTPMTPAERKIVHLTLKTRQDVSTASQGREPNRSVVISPVR
jgi:spoIIIJ-associated protein